MSDAQEAESRPSRPSRPSLPTIAVERLVHDLVRVHLPWARLERDHFELRGLVDREALGRVYLPWYRDPSGALWQGDIHAPDPAWPPSPVQVAETEAALAVYPDRRRGSILRLRDDYRDHRYPQAFYVVAGALASGELMIADGAHRLSALWLAEVDFRIAVFTVRPRDPRGCTDLERLIEHLSPR